MQGFELRLERKPPYTVGPQDHGSQTREALCWFSVQPQLPTFNKLFLN